MCRQTTLCCSLFRGILQWRKKRVMDHLIYHVWEWVYTPEENRTGGTRSRQEIHNREYLNAYACFTLSVNNADYADYVLAHAFPRPQHNQRWLHRLLSWVPSKMAEEVTGGEKNCWINYVILVFFVLKKYSRSFAKLTVLLMSLLCFWTWEHYSCVAVYGGSESSQIPSKIS